MQDNLKLPEGFKIEQAIGGGDCFFDAVAKGLKQLKPDMHFTVKSLREACKRFAQNQLVNHQSWLKEALKNEAEPIDQYIPRIEFTANDIEQESEIVSILGLNSPIWGRSEIEGRMICKEYGIKLHVIEKHDVEGKEIWTNQIIDESGSRSISNIDYNDINTIHVINKGLAHFEPILDNRKLIEKQLNRLKIRIEKITGTDIQKGNQKELTISSTLKESFEPLSPIDEELFNAAEQGNLGAVKRLIEEKGANFKAIDKSGRTPLHLAAYDGYLNIVEYLIEKGDDVITKDNNGLTLLHFAADGGKLDTVKYLIEKGANVNIISDDGSIPICWAAYNGNLDIVKYLIEKGADINVKDENGRTPLYWAVLKGNLEVTQHLIAKGAYINIASNDGITPLHTASLSGRLDIIQYLVERGANVNTQDSLGRTPLHFIAFLKSNLDIVKGLISKRINIPPVADNSIYSDTVKYLIAKGADVNIRDNKGCTPIHLAAQEGSLDIIKCLIEKGANANIKDNNGCTPIHLAAKEGNLDVVKYLADKGADIKCPDKYGSTPLHLAVKRDIIETLLNKGAQVNAKNLHGITLLHLVTLRGDKDIVETLLSKGALVDVQDNEGWTPLHWAALNGHRDIVEVLLKNGALVNTKNLYNKTPLHWAALNGHKDIVKVLLSNGALVNARDDIGWTPLHWAAQKGHKDVVEVLLGKSDQINIENSGKETPLHLAAFNGHKDVVEALLNKGAQVNARGETDWTPLHWAAQKGHKDVVEALLNKGAQINVKDDTGWTPLHLAAFNGNKNVVEALLNKGAQINVKDDRGWTPLHLAARKDHKEVVKVLLDNDAEVNAQDLNGQTALHLAVKNSDLSTTKLLLDYKAGIEVKDKNRKAPLDLVDLAKNKDIAELLSSRLVSQKKVMSLEKCLKVESGSRRKRDLECQFTWQDIDEFNEEKSEPRNHEKIKIDSGKFISYIRSIPEEKRSQLIELADKVDVTGKFQGQVKKFINNYNHLTKVERISSMTTHGMIAKNILADFFNDDYEGVAINLGFIGGGRGFAKVAEATSIKGAELIANGKLMLGRSLRIASPFLARGTSAFVVYDLINQVKEFKAGNNDTFVGIVGDSIYLGVDAVEIGVEVAEAFGIFEGVSSVTGPIGAAIGAVVFVGTDIYIAVKRVDRINEIIHLTGKEKFIEGLRAFIGMKPEMYVEELMEQKQINNQLVKQGIEYLKQHSDIRRYIFPTGKSVPDSCHLVPYEMGCSFLLTRCYREVCKTKFQVDLNTTIVLDRREIYGFFSTVRIDDPDGGRMLCLPAKLVDFQQLLETVKVGEFFVFDHGPIIGESLDDLAHGYVNQDYFCGNSIGIETLMNRTGDYTLIDLGDGDDCAKGFLESQNIFVLGNGQKRIIGGEKSDIFILNGNVTTGYINGRNGVDTIDLSVFAPREESVLVNLYSGYVRYQSYGNNSFSVMQINNRPPAKQRETSCQ